MSTVLVVDDDASIRLMFEVALSTAPYRTLFAEGGQQALDTLATEAVDLMLLDIMMPGVSGADVLRRLDPAGDTPVVVVTGHPGHDGHDLSWFLEQGAIDVFEKPFDMERLLDLVHAMLIVDDAERQEYRRRRLAELRGQA